MMNPIDQIYPIWRPTLYLVLSALFMFSCVERTEEATFLVTEVTPNALDPGAEVEVKGRGFQSLPNTLSISGRPLIVLSWTDQSIRASLPLDVPTGERFLVVSREGIHTAPFPIYINGEGGARLGRQPDLGRSASDLSDDAMIISDQGVDQMLGQTVIVELDDPNATVVIEAETRQINQDTELWISLVARDPVTLGEELGWVEMPLWGAASHLDYPLDRLEFVIMTDSPGPNVAALKGDILGRIFWYHGQLNIPSTATRTTLITLRFKVLEPMNTTPLRIGIPSRFTSLRGVQNQRQKASWSGGSLLLGGARP